ncbi:MAG: TIGR04438 family Trp-rich protein [Variovorax sp.]|jgi:small Trp-rich protein|nr:MAG: TIGR04438 family Trp-rich protein [Variovorax sp.]
MWFLALGLLGLVLKFLEVGPVAGLSWWILLIPFGLAALWWAYADASGYTKRRVIEREAVRKQARIDRQRADLGLFDPRDGRNGRKDRARRK